MSEYKQYTGDQDFDELLEKCFRIMKTKAVDYAEENDRLAEFRATAESLDTDMKKVLGIYMNKHVRSVFKWCRGEMLKGEPIEEKLVDLIVYSLLAYKMAKEEREGHDTHVVDEELPDQLLAECIKCPTQTLLARHAFSHTDWFTMVNEGTNWDCGECPR